MKIRNGFVSNSSSSSFIVAFPYKPESVEELQNWLFPYENHFVSPYAEYDGRTWPVEVVAQIVFQQITKEAPEEEIIKELAYSTHYLSKFNHEDINVFRGMVDKDATKKAKQFLENNAGKFICIFEYCDGVSDLESAMEHGNLFKNLPHLISGHH